MKRKIIAGGLGLHLNPHTRVACKQLLSVHDKPLVYFSLSSRMSHNFREILDLPSSYSIDTKLSLEILPQEAARYYSRRFDDLHKIGIYAKPIQETTGPRVVGPCEMFMGGFNDSI
jgi:hypothetical protein